MRACQLAPAGEPAAAANLREIFAHLLFSFRHCLPKWQAERLPYNSITWTMYRKRVMMQQEKKFVSARMPKPAGEARARKPASAPPATAAYALHIRLRAFAVFGDEAVDPCGDNGQRYLAELEHGLSPRAAVANQPSRKAPASRDAMAG